MGSGRAEDHVEAQTWLWAWGLCEQEQELPAAQQGTRSSAGLEPGRWLGARSGWSKWRWGWM